MTDLKENLGDVQARIARACERAGRSTDDVTLVAVSKTFEASHIEQAYALGLRDFGESYVQEWQEKAAQLAALDVRWHFIGHLQSNKVKLLAGEVHLVHGVDRASVVKAFAKHAETQQPVLLQFNVAGETQKSGASPEELEALLERVTSTPALCIQGLMTVPPYENDVERSRPHFIALRGLRERARQWLDARGLLEAHPCTHLSMGMSGDFEVAIEEGATLVRVGSAIFGARDYSA